jgi:sugar (pentulose or hexulose) kinase
MGGREYAAIAGAGPADAAMTDAEALIAAGTMALPSFTAGGGPFPGTGGKGRIVGPAPESPRPRVALASLYLALMTSMCLDLLRSRGQVIIDGACADNRLFTGLLAALRPRQPVAVSAARRGAALGAALLWGWSERSAPAPLELTPVVAPGLAGLSAYERRWRRAAEAAGHSQAIGAVPTDG